MEHMGTQHNALWPRVEALLKCAHELATSAEDSTTEAPPASLRGEVDLNSLSRERLEAFLHERGVAAPPGYSLGDLVTLAKQAKFFMKKPTAAKPLPASPSCGFTLAKRPSSISGAGEGVFIQGKASRGTVVAFYPGCVYAESDLPLVYPHIYTDNDYLAFRSDKMLIDASSKGSSRQAFLAAWSRDHPRQQPPSGDKIDFAEVFANSYAVGHLVNHPPADRRPNVVSLPFDFLAADLDAHDHLRRHIPNVYFLPRRHEGDAGADGVVMSGMVIVAADDLEDGAELLMDYHYGMRGADVPSWYRPAAGLPVHPSVASE
ncbi:uncharacterized protein ACA1_298810 [Acanthamoeba castellanii str. Neff]|uniref:SET domain-containing protein n=1 Tax=Acanthamoeba castellanii (strain ATCC 30010 / Neff) TaxID=1257118 RepID=L8H1K7_ACACF|nr:uncharacterized protein ACA1_298810 [Acanthamoeba castellanii str. Neff]ELR18638.1 hypothetical protein ACA1_298810 [Acanthamoeba castellanii str. Neff]